MYILILFLILCILILFILLLKKTKTEDNKQSEYKLLMQQIGSLLAQKNDLQNELIVQKNTLQDYNDKILEIQNKYREELNKKTSDLDIYFENQKQFRQSEMDVNFDKLLREKQEALELKKRSLEYTYNEKIEDLRKQTEEIVLAAQKSQQAIVEETQYQQQRFEALLEPLKKYEMQMQERLFYTIQISDEYKADIDFLLTTAATKVKHPNIISKLIWSEYIKPALDETIKRLDIKNEPGIYKITYIPTGKCYVGKSTDVKKRITDHVRASVGISKIAWQAIHDEIARTGCWNWTIEVITYCEKDKLNELEKYYINFFDSQKYGFNKNQGGGGG